jgi:hypothetical protein
MGVGMAVGTVAMLAATPSGGNPDPRYFASGAASGLLFGVIGAAIAAGITRSEERQRAKEEAKEAAQERSTQDRVAAAEAEIMLLKEALNANRSRQSQPVNDTMPSPYHVQ